MTWDAFLDQIRDWLATRNLLGEGASWVIGLSGGPDSTLLLHTLAGLSERHELHWRLHAAHLHHGLRGAEADEDAAFAARIAEGLDVPFHVERADVPGAVARDGGSTEEVARSHRYGFLERVALTAGSELVAVAHHADDNAETVLHRICRGTGLRGLVGIHDVRPLRPGSHIRLVRPFLQQRRATIEELCAARALTTREDSTNRSPDFTRGRIRHTVMPLLAEQLNPNVVEALLRLAEHARWLGTYLDDAAARTFEALVISQEGRRVALNVHALTGKQHIIQAEVVRRAIALAAGGEQDLSFGNIEAILRLTGDPASGKEVHVPGPVVVRKQYERLEFRPLEDEGPAVALETVFVTCPGRTVLPQLGFELLAEVHAVDAERIEALRRNTNRLEEWLDFDRVRQPVFVRGRHEGDRFRPLGNPGAKTIGDFFGEQKIDPQMRARIGILCDQGGVLWVMPWRIDERAKLRPTTRTALRLVLTPAAVRPLDAP